MTTQQRAPTSDQSETGTWSGATAGTRYTVVNDHPDSAGSTVLTHGTTAGTLMLGYSAFSVPAGSTITQVLMRCYSYRNGSQTSNQKFVIQVGGVVYDNQSAMTPPNGLALISLQERFWTTNPATSAAWTVAQVNGTDATNPLQYFGWKSTDASPTVAIASIQFEVTYTLPTYSLTAAQGTYTRTGQATSLRFNRRLISAQGTYARTGQNANLLFNRRLISAQGTYSRTGQAVSLRQNRRLISAQGTYTRTGQTTLLRYHRRLLAVQGSYSRAGQVANLLLNRRLIAGQGTFTRTGQNVSLRFNRRLSAAQGSYSRTGQNVNLLQNRRLIAGQGSFSRTGQNANLLFNRRLLAGQGTYTRTGQDANLLFNRRLIAGQGTYARTGQDANLLRNRRLIAGQGTYSRTGQATRLLFHRRLITAQGTYTRTAFDVGLIFTPIGGPTYTLSAGLGTYARTGFNADLVRHRVLVVEQGTFAQTGNDANLLFHRRLTAQSGNYTRTGQAINLLYHRRLTAASGLYVLTGSAAVLTYSETTGFYEALGNTLRVQFQTLVGTPNGLSVCYDNTKWEDQTIRLANELEETRNDRIGGQRAYGVLIVSIFTPKGEGDKEGLEIAAAVHEAFRELRADNVIFRAPYIKSRARENERWRIDVCCPYYAE